MDKKIYIISGDIYMNLLKIRKFNTPDEGNNKGFTLVELLVVLVLMSIMLGATLFAGLGWQDWAQFRHEEAVAEEIFYAAQNQLTELDSSNALYRKVARPLMNSETKGDYKSNYLLSNNVFEEIVYKKNGNADVKYKMDSIWINSNKDKDPGKLVRLKANANEYDKYLDGFKDDTTTSEEHKKEVKLLFDIISPYISDKSVLNGAIILEFSPDAGQVFSVCYSDRATSLVYGSGSGESISVMNRVLQERESMMLGYFSVDTLSQKVRGRGTIDMDLKLRIDNGNTFMLVVEDTKNELEEKDTLEFNLFDGDTSDNVMSFSIKNSDINQATSIKDGLQNASQNTIDIQASFPEGSVGKYAKSGGGIETFRIPAFKVSKGAGFEIYIILDAADVQAQSLAYSNSIYFKGKEGHNYTEDNDEAFRNTYSFYRFGLSNSVNYIYANLDVIKSDAMGMPAESLASKIDSYSEDPTVKHINESTPKGECPTFASHEKTETDVYEISNMRHFYNIRYESDYKSQESKKDTFKLIDNISWNEFVGKSGTSGVNYFLDSSTISNATVSGINYKGTVAEVSGTTTADYPFPGFRKLDKNDIFTQEVAYGGAGDSYSISDLNITIAGNIIYGVYGKDIMDSCRTSKNYTATQGYETGYTALDSSGMHAARAGKMPLGLFAENQGSIENISLNRHVVQGLMATLAGSASSNNIIYTCMVGGFAGNNLGKISGLTVLDMTEGSDDPDDAGVSKINGRTDVGGIIGRQSYVVAGGNRNSVISGMTNYATVSGLENVGGILGRAYVRFVTDKTGVNESFNNIYSNATYDGAEVSAYRDIINRYYYYHDGYEITDSYLSMTGTEVERNDTITIESCKNRGLVKGDDLTYNLMGKVKIRIANNGGTGFEDQSLQGCAFIGGIAGVTMDGIMFDYDNGKFKVSGSNLYPVICDSYLKDGDANIIVKNCQSYVQYDDNDFDLEQIVDENYNRAKYDNYVGGLVGYARLTAFENCNAKPDDIETEDGVAKTLVLGHRYVGGIVGCSDSSRFDQGDAGISSDGYPGRIYAATNYNNVIGSAMVGGIAGATGLGYYKDKTLWYRNPSVRYPEVSNRKTGEESSPALVKNVLNTGIVLCLKEMPYAGDKVPDSFAFLTSDWWSQPVSKDNYCGNVGGIVGMSSLKLENTDNIQSESVKKFIVRTIIKDDIDYSNIDIDAVVASSKTSKFGGVSVGGIAGYQRGLGGSEIEINRDSDSASFVDAVVFGQTYVGGMIGIINSGDRPFINNVYPYKKDSSSSGMFVLGEDCVGGIVGRIQIDALFKNNSPITDGYTVCGRYSVGGYAGIDAYYSGHDAGRINFSLDLNTEDRVRVYGACFVGGILGYSSANNIDIPDKDSVIDFDHVDIKGDYFVGGLAGCIAESTNNASISFVKRIRVGDDVSVSAVSYAGGLVGLYSLTSKNHEEFFNHNGKPFKLANELCVYSGSESDRIRGTFNNIVQADNATDDLFDKATSRSVTIDFDNYGNMGEYSNKLNVTSGFGPGGLFGYVPNGLNITVKGFVNSGNLKVTNSIPGSMINEASDKNAVYSYLGGVIGRIPRGMRIVNSANTKNNDNYTSKGTYIGGLAEVNAGVVSGDYSTDTMGIETVSNYLISYTDYTYDNANVAAFVGVNGTLANGCEGIIKYVQNQGIIESTNGTASGIAAAQGGASTIEKSINLGDVNSANSTAAGIVASPSGLDTVVLCRNYAQISGSSSYGIAGGVVGTITRNLEAGGLSDTPIAPAENNLTRNFYIFGNESDIPVVEVPEIQDDTDDHSFKNINFKKYFVEGYTTSFITNFGPYMQYFYDNEEDVENVNPKCAEYHPWVVSMSGKFDTFENFVSYAALVYSAYYSSTDDGDIDNYMEYLNYVYTNNSLRDLTTNYTSEGSLAIYTKEPDPDPSTLNNVITTWPLKLQSVKAGDTYSLEFYKVNTFRTTGISGLTNDPINYQTSAESRKGYYLESSNGENSLDTKFLIMVEDDVDYPDTYFVD